MGDTPVTMVRLEIGKLSGVVVDSIRFCFDLVAEDTTLAGARLVVDEPPGLARCRPCGTEFDRTVLLEQKVLSRNDERAERNREWLGEHDILAVNLMSSPGSGKTTLLERTIRELGAEVPLSVVEGDQETLFDAERIQATGCRVVQVNTPAPAVLDDLRFVAAWLLVTLPRSPDRMPARVTTGSR